MEFDGFFWNRKWTWREPHSHIAPIRWEDYGNGGPIGGPWNAVAIIWELCLQKPSHGIRHRRHRHHSAFHVKVMDLFHATWLSSAIVSQVPGCICLHLVVAMFFHVTKNFNALAARDAVFRAWPVPRLWSTGHRPTEAQLVQMCGIFSGFRLWQWSSIPQWESKHNVYVSYYIYMCV